MSILPNPVFEGVEKRLELDFVPTSNASPAGGLRVLSRFQLDELMTLARCCIVSSRSNSHCDAYVLSESSLFVTATKWVLKTCGTTRLLDSLPRLLELAAPLGLTPVQCKFSRSNFLFPEQQPFPHTSFEDEVRYLDTHLSQQPLISSLGKAFVLGDASEGLQWHKYVTGRRSTGTFNLEICMTELGDDAAQQFHRTESFISAAQTTKDTGILGLMPNATIDDYVFEPCGYSMNGIDGTGLITIHITPEPGFSYASVEVSGFTHDLTCPNRLLEAAIQIFKPGKVAMALSMDEQNDSFTPLAGLPSSYRCPCAMSTHKVGDSGLTYFYNMVKDEKRACPSSPVSILHHAASTLSFASTDSNSGDNSGGNSSEAEL